MKIVDLKCAIIGKSPIVRVVTDEGVSGPGPADVGGIAELKWIAEYADLHSIMMARARHSERAAWPRCAHPGLRHPPP